MLPTHMHAQNVSKVTMCISLPHAHR